MKKITLLILTLLLVGCGDKNTNEEAVVIDQTIIEREATKQTEVDTFLAQVTLTTGISEEVASLWAPEEKIDIHQTVGVYSKIINQVMIEDIKNTLFAYTIEVDQGLLGWYKVLLTDGTEGYAASRTGQSAKGFNSSFGYQLIFSDNTVKHMPVYNTEVTIIDSLIEINHLVLMEFNDITHYQVISLETGKMSNIEGDMILSASNEKFIANYNAFYYDEIMYAPQSFGIYQVNNGQLDKEFYIESAFYNVVAIKWLSDDHVSFTKDMNGTLLPFDLIKQKTVWVMLPFGEVVEDYFPEGVPTKVNVDVTELNIRTEATTESESKGKAEKDKVYDVMSISIDSDGMVWLQVNQDEWLAEMYTTKVE